MKLAGPKNPFLRLPVLWGLTILLGLSILVGIQDMPLRDYREARYAQLGQEILESGDWIVPHLNGTPYLNKPPMVPWMVAASMWLLGKDEGAARLPAALAAMGIALCVGRFVSLCGTPLGGILGALLFLGSPGVQYWGRMLSSDIIFSFFVVLSLLAFLRGIRESKRGYCLLGFGLSGLAVMCKGLGGLIYPLGSLLLYFLLRGRGEVFRIPWFWGILVVFGICCPWFIATELREPGFLAHHFVKQQFMRVSGEEAFVSLPRWQILAGFAGFLGPLLLLLPCGLLSSGEGRDVKGLLWTFSLLVIASVMVSSGRNHTYTIPALPTVVALVASGIAHRDMWLWRWPGTILLGLLAGGCLVGGVVASDYLPQIHPRLATEDTAWRISLGLGMVGVLLIGGAWSLAQGRIGSLASFVAGIMIPGGWILSTVQGALSCVESRKELALWIAKNVSPSLPVFIVDPQDVQFEGTGGWNFYSGRRVFMVSFQDPGTITAQAQTVPHWVVSKDAFIDIFKSGTSMVLVSTPQGLAKLGVAGLGPPHASDEKFQVWILEGGSAGKGRSRAAHLQTGKTSLSSTWPQEG